MVIFYLGHFARRGELVEGLARWLQRASARTGWPDTADGEALPWTVLAGVTSASRGLARIAVDDPSGTASSG
jgi:hypothetical protein